MVKVGIGKDFVEEKMVGTWTFKFQQLHNFNLALLSKVGWEVVGWNHTH